MRYALAGGVALLGAILLGLAAHNHLHEAWQVVSQ